MKTNSNKTDKQTQIVNALSRSGGRFLCARYLSHGGTYVTLEDINSGREVRLHRDSLVGFKSGSVAI